MGGKYVGAVVRRREDPRLLTGRGRYVDDLRPPGCLHAVVVRSTHAHARLIAVRADAARRLPGVAGCFTFADFDPALRPLPTAGTPSPALARAVRFEIKAAAQRPLARSTVRYVGEPVAVVLAEDPYAAHDAAAAVGVDYDALPAAADVEAALCRGAPLVHEEWDDNLAVRFAVRIGNPDAAFARAATRVRHRFKVPRAAGVPLEPRGVLAVPDPTTGGMTVWASTQVPHLLQRALAVVLGRPPHRLRVIAPDVGGGFGTKCSVYPEDVLVPLLAARLDRPVKWLETRREHLQASAHSREQLHDAEVAAAADGVILGFRDRFCLDQGAYNPWGIVQPYNTVAHMLGPYRIPNAAFEARSVVTNKTPHAPYRGAGRPEAVFVMERILELLAHELRMDPAALRRRNILRGDEMPYDVGLRYRDGTPLVYDGGDYAAALEQALAAVDYDRFRDEQRALRARGVFWGAGIAAYVEGTGIGPYESASVRVDPAGTVRVVTGACSQGQGHETTFAQIAADALDVDLQDVTVAGGDTAEIDVGIGTFASRSIVVAGNGVAEAAAAVRAKVIAAAAALLEAPEGDIVVDAGRVFVRGAPARGLTLAQIVEKSLPTFQGRVVADPVFAATSYYHVPTVTFASAVHIALVEVDAETAAVVVRRYVVVHDCGRLVHPQIVEGQIHGGVAQGIGAGLWEEIAYDGSGQLLSGSLMDYALPRAAAMPRVEIIHQDTRSSRNPLGVKGVGEGGAIAPPAALANAVEDALSPFGIRIGEGPLTPARILGLLREAGPGRSAVDGSGPL